MRVIKPIAPGHMITVTIEDGLEAIKLQIMQRSIEVCGGNITSAARLLKLSRKTFYNRLLSKEN